MRVRDQARAGLCLYNLRQIGPAFNLYAGDNNGWLPAAQISDDTGKPLAYWSDLLANPAWGGVYIQNDRVFACPAFTDCGYPTMAQIRAKGFLANGADRLGYVHYGYDYASFGRYSGPLCKLVNVRSPSQTLLLAECIRYANPANGYALLSYPPLRTVNGALAPRHSGGVNILWMDGHATRIQCSDPSLPYQTVDNQYWWSLQ